MRYWSAIKVRGYGGVAVAYGAKIVHTELPQGHKHMQKQMQSTCLSETPVSLEEGYTFIDLSLFSFPKCASAKTGPHRQEENNKQWHCIPPPCFFPPTHPSQAAAAPSSQATHNRGTHCLWWRHRPP